MEKWQARLDDRVDLGGGTSKRLGDCTAADLAAAAAEARRHGKQLDGEAGKLEAAAGKVRENRLRRMAERQGLRLEKSRRRDPRAIAYGTYMLVNARNNTIEAGDHNTGYGLTLDQVEAALTEE